MKTTEYFRPNHSWANERYGRLDQKIGRSGEVLINSRKLARMSEGWSFSRLQHPKHTFFLHSMFLKASVKCQISPKYRSQFWIYSPSSIFIVFGIYLKLEYICLYFIFTNCARFCECFAFVIITKFIYM